MALRSCKETLKDINDVKTKGTKTRKLYQAKMKEGYSGES